MPRVPAPIHPTNLNEDMVVGLYSTDCSGNFLCISPTFCLLLGYSRSELLQKKHQDLVFSEDLLIYQLLIERLHSQELDICQVSLRYLQKNGQLTRLLIQIQRLKDQSEYFMHRFEELQLHNQVENVLRHTVGLGLSLFENNPLPMWIYDLQSLKFLAVNQSAIRHYGYSQEEFLSMAITDIRPPEDIPKLLESIAQMPKGYCSDGVWRHRTRSGKIIYVETSAHSITYGERPAEIVLAHDVTELKMTEIALRQAEIKYRSIFENAIEGIFQTTAEGKYITANPMLAKIYGYPTPQALIENLTDIGEQLYVNPQRREDFIRILQNQDAVWNFEAQVYRRDGSIIWISENARAVRDTDGKLLYFEGTVQDITAEKRTQEELKLLQTITEAINSAEDFDSALALVLRHICQVTGWQVGEAWIPTEDGSQLQMSPSYYVSSADLELFRSQSAHLSMPKGVGLPGRIWQTQKPEWLQDISMVDQTQFLRRDLALQSGLKATFAVPILSAVTEGKRTVIALMVFLMQRARPEDTRLINLVSTIATQLSTLMQRKRMEVILREREESLRLTFENAPIGIAMTTIEGRFLQVNPIFSAITGYTREQLLQLNALTLLAIDLSVVEHLFKDNTRLQLEKHLHNLDRSPVDVMIYGAVVRNEEGEPQYLIIQLEDITERKRAKAKIEHLAFHDALTDLPNRVLFMEKLHQALNFGDESANQLAVMFLDLDRFKQVNDTFGHDMGDLLLQKVVKRLASHIRSSDTLARMGGDEFMLLMPQIPSSKVVECVAKRIIDSFAMPFLLGQHEVRVGVSIGISIYPENGTDPETLIKNADTAMFRAKEQGRNNFQFYTAAIGMEAQVKAGMEYGIRQALERSEFVVYYQPRYNTISQKVIGVEALVRWQNPELGLLFPKEFIGCAEDCGLIVPLGEWIFRTVCAQHQTWQKLVDYPFILSVNCSGLQFQHPSFIEQVQNIMQATAICPHCLELEITESVMIKSSQGLIATFEQLQQMGVKISIDDFGTGYSCLSQLQQLPVQRLKIDRSFIQNIPHNQRNTAITKAIVAMAHGLNLEVVAEGIETRDQLQFLQDLGCEAVQGYLLCPPVTEVEVTHILERQGRNGTL